MEDEYAGCVYATPCARDGEVTWRRDAEGRPFPWDLTRAQIAGMKFEGLPIRLEHADKRDSPYGNEV